MTSECAKCVRDYQTRVNNLKKEFVNDPVVLDRILKYFPKRTDKQ